MWKISSGVACDNMYLYKQAHLYLKRRGLWRQRFPEKNISRQHVLYLLSSLCILHNVEQILYPTCVFMKYETLLEASKLSYLPMQLQSVQTEVGR